MRDKTLYIFEQSLLDVGKASSGRPWPMLVSLVLQCLLLGILTLIPLYFTPALPKQELLTFLVAPVPPPPPPPSPPTKAAVRVIKPHQSEIKEGRLIAPRGIPKHVAMIEEEQVPLPAPVGVGGVLGGVPGGSLRGVMGGIIGGVNVPLPPPPPAAPRPKPKPPLRIRVGGQVQQAKIINQKIPDYPWMAKQARIQGTVRLEAVIAKDGTIEQLHVLSGHPLLIEAALDAVKEWRYRPTYLNGQAVEVSTVVTVNFRLG